MKAGGAALLLGGSSSGKSMTAQRLARDTARRTGRPLFYLATMQPMDGEDSARVARHRRDREGWGFETLEIPIRVSQAAERCAGGVVLLDSVTTLLTNAMFAPDGFQEAAEEPVWEELSRLMAAAFHTVLVSDDLFSDGLFYDAGTESFRRQLGHLHRRLAADCGRVIRLTCGAAEEWKGGGTE